MEPDVSDAVEGTDYEIDIASHREVLFYKQQTDGRRTMVEIERRGGDNSLSVLEVEGRKEVGHAYLGAHETLAEAVDSAGEWMQANPEGVNLQCL